MGANLQGTPTLEMRGVGREFGTASGTRVGVADVSLRVEAGTILCVLGPNGAGKTTTVRMASTLLIPTRGKIFVNGIDAVADPRRARERTGLVLGGDRGFYLRATAGENLQFFGELQGVTGRRRRHRVPEVLEQVGLTDRSGDRVETFSRGMKQRLHLARALLAQPSLLLLDEPSIGLDPEGARDLRQLVLGLRSAGHGILLTTHYLHEAEEIADELMVIDHGRVAARGSVQDIAGVAGVGAVTSLSTADLSPGLAERSENVPGVIQVVDERRRGVRHVDIMWDSSGSRVDSLRGIWGQDTEYVTRPASLEESYLAFLAGRNPQ